MKQTRIFSLLILAVFAYGCFSGSSPTRTFVLSAVDLEASESTVKVQIGRIVLPAYLKRWEMVTLINGQEVRINDFAQWGELLEEGVRRTLTENFRQVLGAEQVTANKSTTEKGYWRLDYEFLALTGNEKGVFFVKTLCRASNAGNKKVFTIAFDMPYLVAKSERSLVEAHADALGRLVLETIACLQTDQEQETAH